MKNTSDWLSRARELFKRAREILARIGKDPRYKWYRRGLWVLSVLWAAIVVIQSVSY